MKQGPPSWAPGGDPGSMTLNGTDQTASVTGVLTPNDQTNSSVGRNRRRELEDRAHALIGLQHVRRPLGFRSHRVLRCLGVAVTQNLDEGASTVGIDVLADVDREAGLGESLDRGTQIRGVDLPKLLDAPDHDAASTQPHTAIFAPFLATVVRGVPSCRFQARWSGGGEP